MSFEAIRTGRSARGIATILLARPERFNALDPTLLSELALHLSALAADESVRVVVVRGEGRHFCAGADVRARRAAPEADGSATLPEVLARLDALPRPTIAAVHGACLGGGLGLALCCDVAVAAEDAFFSIPEVRLGFPPSALASYCVRAMGVRNFRRYGLSGERFSAADALRMGVVHRLAASGGLDAAVEDIVEEMLLAAPGAIAELKAAVAAPASGLSPADQAERDARNRARMNSAEAREGIASFLEKRKPSWYPKP